MVTLLIPALLAIAPPATIAAASDSLPVQTEDVRYRNGTPRPDSDGSIPDGILGAAALVVDRAPAIDRVWPGFWPEPRPYVLYEYPSWSLLFTRDEPLPGFEPVDPASLPASLRGTLYLRPGPITTLGEDWHRGGAILPAPVPVVGPTGLRGYSQVEVILHETFHFWQRARWPDAHRRQPADCTPQRYEAAGLEPPSGFRDAEVIELALLRDAVLASTRKELTSRIRAYLDARRTRLDPVDPLFAAIDQRQERDEGSAEFAGLAGSLAARDGAGPELQPLLRDTLASQLAGFEVQWDASAFTASQRGAARAYRAGAASAFLLDALEVAGWRQEIERGEFFDVLLAGAVQADDYLRWQERTATSRPCLESGG